MASPSTPPDSESRGSSSRTWPALVVEATRPDQEDLVAVVLDDFSPAAIEDLAPQPLPPGGIWDPSFPPLPEPPAAPIRWRVFFNNPDDRERARAALAGVADLQLESVDVADDDWAARSQRALTAIRAARFVVAPPWDIPADLDAALTLIVIEPSRGFGTGHHPTTRLCLAALAAIDVGDKRVLDLGTGSGVLAIAASLSGAGEVLAIDVDGDAIEAARVSAALNPLRAGIEFGVADFREPSSGLPRAHYDVVLANLTGGMLTHAASRIVEVLAAGGHLVVSGFLESQRSSVRRAFAGLREVAAYSEDEWVALALANA